jgi:hypothetical protein
VHTRLPVYNRITTRTIGSLQHLTEACLTRGTVARDHSNTEQGATVYPNSSRVIIVEGKARHISESQHDPAQAVNTWLTTQSCARSHR